MSNLQKEKEVSQNEMGICFILEHWLSPLQLELTATAGEHRKHSCINRIWKHLN